MNKTYTTQEIKRESEHLLNEVNQTALELKKHPKSKKYPLELKPLLNQVEVFINDLENFSTQADHIQIDDYIWLNKIAVKWQLVLAKVFHLQRRINIAEPKNIDSPSTESGELLREIPFSANELEKWIKDKAYELSKDRRMALLWDKSQEYEGVFNFLLREIIVSSKDEELLDNYTAKVFLASEILDGTINFVHRIPSECYNQFLQFLEERWIKEVKKLKAYYSCKKLGNGDETIIKENYYEACEQIRQALIGTLNPNVKVGSEDFIEIKNYLEKHYLTNGKIDSQDHKKGKKLIVTKAEYISKNTYHLRKHNESIASFNYRNWRWAETFVKNFYENIIGAVEDNDVDKVARVLSAFQIQEVVPEGFKISLENHDLITNCFEAAIAIYFLSPTLLNKCQEEGKLANIFI